MILQGNSYRIPLADESVHLRPKLAFRVKSAVYPSVASAAKGDQIIQVFSQSLIASPRFNMMSVKPIVDLMVSSTADAAVIISGVNLPDYLFPFTRGINSLAFRGTSIFIIWVKRTSSLTSPIAMAAQVWLGYRCFFAQYCARLFGMFSSKKWIDDAGPLHKVVFIFEILSTRAGRYAKVTQLAINSFVVAIYEFADFVSRKTFNQVFLS